MNICGVPGDVVAHEIQLQFGIGERDLKLLGHVACAEPLRAGRKGEAVDGFCVQGLAEDVRLKADIALLKRRADSVMPAPVVPALLIPPKTVRMRLAPGRVQRFDLLEFETVGCVSSSVVVIRQSEQLGESGALLFARDLRFYEKNGFEQLDRVIRAPLTTTDDDAPTDCFEFEEVEALYAAWSQAHPDRLRRDEQRWNYWRWHYRICTPFQEGYICFEPHVLREPLYARPVTASPFRPARSGSAHATWPSSFRSRSPIPNWSCISWATTSPARRRCS